MKIYEVRQECENLDCLSCGDSRRYAAESPEAAARCYFFFAMNQSGQMPMTMLDLIDWDRDHKSQPEEVAFSLVVATTPLRVVDTGKVFDLEENGFSLLHEAIGEGTIAISIEQVEQVREQGGNITTFGLSREGAQRIANKMGELGLGDVSAEVLSPMSGQAPVVPEDVN